MWIVSLFAFLSVADGLNAATYYVACDGGNDSNVGLSELTAWNSASKASKFNFQDGDTILFKRGCTWEDVSIKITRSLTFGAYGDIGSAPQLMGATHSSAWSNLAAKHIVYTQAAVEPGVPSIKEVLIVHDGKHGLFYDKVSNFESLISEGQFFHDVAKDTLYVIPLEGTDLQQDIHFSSKPHILEFQQLNVESVVVDGLHLSFANEYAVGFWYQSSGTTNGSLKITNCTFTGNAYQAIHIGGTNTFRQVDILNNTITANGNEGIYIGFIKGSEEGQVITGKLTISGNVIGGQRFGWRSEGPGSAANGEGIDLKKGIAAASIDNNTLFDLTGFYGIGVQFSNVIIEKNTVSDIHMWDSPPESGISGIIVDANESSATTIVRNNKLNVQAANGIAIRGNAERRPRFEIYDNEISVKEPYFPLAFTSQNITNTLIEHNRTNGGRAGLWVQRACCTPANVEFRDNDIRNVSLPLVAAQNVSGGVRVYSNFFCFNGAVDESEINTVPNNSFSRDCTALKRMNPPRQIQVR